MSLVSRVDLSSRSIAIGNDVRVQLHPKHIEKLIGTPSRGRQVCGLDTNTPEERTNLVRLAMGSQQFYNNGLKAAEVVVRWEWDGSVTGESRVVPSSMRCLDRRAFSCSVHKGLTLAAPISSLSFSSPLPQ